MSRSIHFLAAAFLILVTAACSPTADNTTASNAHTVTLADADEPGQRLTLHGQVLDSATGQPLSGVEIYLYHADANGKYLPTNPADESTAKLSGAVTSGPDGQFTVHTIVPREYDQPGNRHIHLHYVRAAGYADLGGVVLFEDDVNAEIRQWAEDTGFGIIIDLEERDGIQVGTLTLALEEEN